MGCHLGFVSVSKVVGIEDLLNVVIDKQDEEMVQALVDAMQQHVDYHRIHPYRDSDSLKIVLDCVNRNAVKHTGEREGPYERMVKGFNEVTELISKGTVNGKRKNKPLDQFQDAGIQTYLTEIRDKIGKIVGLVNLSRHGGSYVDIPTKRVGEIDAIKHEIARLSNEISAKHRLGVTINIH